MSTWYADSAARRSSGILDAALRRALGPNFDAARHRSGSLDAASPLGVNLPQAPQRMCVAKPWDFVIDNGNKALGPPASCAAVRAKIKLGGDALREFGFALP